MTTFDLNTTDPDFAVLDFETRRTIERGIVGAISFHGELSPLQRRILRAIGSSILGVDFDVDHESPALPDELAAALVDQPEQIRHRVIQFMMVLELVLRPLPPEVAERVIAYARALQISDELLSLGRDYAQGSWGLALKDMERGGTFHDFDHHGKLERAVHVHKELTDPFEHFHHDPELLAEWEALGELPPDSLGRLTWEFYRSRGFDFPGAPGSVAPTLAQHDFVHVVCDYGATMEGEIETFAFIAASDPDPHGFSWLATVLGVFETGYVPDAAGGILEMDRGHLENEGMCARLADALRRGRLVHRNLVHATDWFELAPLSVAEVRERLNVVPKSEVAVQNGSVGLADRGSYSTWQVEHGRAELQRWR